MKVSITTPWQLSKSVEKHHIVVELEAVPRKGEILHGKKLADFLKKETDELKVVPKSQIELCVGAGYCPDKLIYVGKVCHNIDSGRIVIELTSHEDGSCI